MGKANNYGGSEDSPDACFGAPGIWVAFFRVPARIVKGHQQCLCEQETAPNWDGKAYEQMRELRELCFERLQEQSDAQAMAKILGAHALRIPRF